MSSSAPDLLESIAVERIEHNLYRGAAVGGHGGPRLFGGHVIAQALVAGYETVETRVCHSLHGYFMRPGDPRIPILYEVDRARDGGSFTTRRVIAIQNGEQIFNLAASFQAVEDGRSHQMPGPSMPPLPSEADFAQAPPSTDPEAVRRNAAFARRPVEMSEIEPRAFNSKEPAAPGKTVWVRARDTLGDDIRRHHAALAYASDMNLLETSMRPHGATWATPGLQSASLDHALWFHQPFDFSEWHLFAQDSPISHATRGFVRAGIYAQDGRLVASVAQEGLIRFREPKA